MNLKHNEVEYYRTHQLEEDSDLKTKLTILENKLDSVTRQVSFWDIYNVTQILLSDNDILTKLPKLNIGESAIVNTTRINNGQNVYSRGDLIYKNQDGDFIHIPAENKGVYVPELSYVGSNVKLKYKYSRDIPDTIEETLGYNTLTGYCTDTDLLANVTTTNFVISINEVLYNNQLIQPIIKFYLGNTLTSSEEIYLDYTWKHNTTTHKIDITIIAPHPAIHIRVR